MWILRTSPLTIYHLCVCVCEIIYYNSCVCFNQTYAFTTATHWLCDFVSKWQGFEIMRLLSCILRKKLKEDVKYGLVQTRHTYALLSLHTWRNERILLLLHWILCIWSAAAQNGLHSILHFWSVDRNVHSRAEVDECKHIFEIVYSLLSQLYTYRRKSVKSFENLSMSFFWGVSESKCRMQTHNCLWPT